MLLVRRKWVEVLEYNGSQKCNLVTQSNSHWLNYSISIENIRNINEGTHTFLLGEKRLSTVLCIGKSKLLAVVYKG